MITNKVYTYYEDFGNPDHGWMLEMWKRNWECLGWQPVVLGLRDARKFFDFDRVDRTVSEFPTVNSKEYELACFRRWMALVYVGGGFMTDYDVLSIWMEPYLSCGKLTIWDVGKVPCAVSGSVWEIYRMLEWFKAYRPTGKDLYEGRPHVSDMTICQTRTDVKVVDNVEYCDDPKDKGMVHFSGSRCPRGKRKAVEVWEPRRVGGLSRLGF